MMAPVTARSFDGGAIGVAGVGPTELFNRRLEINFEELHASAFEITDAQVGVIAVERECDHHAGRVRDGVVNLLVLISSGANRGTREGRLRTNAALRQPSLRW
jgi:hypothetical protein